MLDTLRQYIDDAGLPRIDLDDMKQHIGGIRSQYYAACYAIVKNMLLAPIETKKRGLVFNGEADSGKTSFARFLSNIFLTHWNH